MPAICASWKRPIHHLWVSNEPDTPADGADLRDIERLTNESFEPVVLPEQGWQHVPWPPELRFNPLASGNTSWLFESDETWYLGHAVP